MRKNVVLGKVVLTMLALGLFLAACDTGNGGNPLTGTTWVFVADDESVTQTLTFVTDAAFSVVVVSKNGGGTMEGVYTYNEPTVTCTITKVTGSGGGGPKVGDIYSGIVNGNTLTVSGDGGSTIFIRQ